MDTVIKLAWDVEESKSSPHTEFLIPTGTERSDDSILHARHARHAPRALAALYRTMVRGMPDCGGRRQALESSLTP